MSFKNLKWDFLTLKGKEYRIVEKQIYEAKYTVVVSDKFKNLLKQVYKNVKWVNIDELLTTFTKYFSFEYFLKKHWVYKISELPNKWFLYKAYPPIVLWQNKNVKNSGHRLILAINENENKIVLIHYYTKTDLKQKEENLLNHYNDDYKKVLLETLSNEYKETV